MDGLREFVHRSHNPQPLWLTDVRAAFCAAEDADPLILRLDSFDGRQRVFHRRLPRWQSEEERGFVRDVLCAEIYNIMCVCGGWRMTLFADLQACEIIDLLYNVTEFMLRPSAEKKGFKKVFRVANRMAKICNRKEFYFTIADISEFDEPRDTEKAPCSPAAVLRVLARKTEGARCVGIDVGGTDIKLAAASFGRIVAVKEYDWNPAAFTEIDRLTEPILLLTRLMRACLAAEGSQELTRVLRKDAGLEEIAAAVRAAEARTGTDVLDAVGVSFPDIVLYDHIIGGETPKTAGVRLKAGAAYDAEFAKLGLLRERLLALCRSGGACRLANDGSAAAFTAAMELACGDAPESVGDGVIAHTLGTDLGTGWLDERGELPQLPLEFYDLWMDMGSGLAAALPPEDLRSSRSENSGLPGVRRCVGQSAAYRLAWEQDPALLSGYTEERGGILSIRTEPADLRKPCLEHLMRLAEQGNAAAEAVFRQIGANLAVVSREMDELLHPKAKRRYLYGRFVKSARCFALLREGCGAQGHFLENAGEALTATPLMRQLAEREDVTPAQFAQAVGMLYFALS